MNRKEAEERVLEAAQRWAQELYDEIIPYTTDQEDFAGFAEQHFQLEKAISIMSGNETADDEEWQATGNE